VAFAAAVAVPGRRPEEAAPAAAPAAEPVEVRG
jgi:hypothetical protein